MINGVTINDLDDIRKAQNKINRSRLTIFQNYGYSDEETKAALQYLSIKNYLENMDDLLTAFVNAKLLITILTSDDDTNVQVIEEIRELEKIIEVEKDAPLDYGDGGDSGSDFEEEHLTDEGEGSPYNPLFEDEDEEEDNIGKDLEDKVDSDSADNDAAERAREQARAEAQARADEARERAEAAKAAYEAAQKAADEAQQKYEEGVAKLGDLGQQDLKGESTTLIGKIEDTIREMGKGARTDTTISGGHHIGVIDAIGTIANGGTKEEAVEHYVDSLTSKMNDEGEQVPSNIIPADDESRGKVNDTIDTIMQTTDARDAAEAAQAQAEALQEAAAEAEAEAEAAQAAADALAGDSSDGGGTSGSSTGGDAYGSAGSEGSDTTGGCTDCDCCDNDCDCCDSDSCSDCDCCDNDCDCCVSDCNEPTCCDSNCDCCDHDCDCCDSDCCDNDCDCCVSNCDCCDHDCCDSDCNCCVGDCNDDCTGHWSE